MNYVAFLFTLFILLIIILAGKGQLGILSWLNQIPYGDKIGHFVLYGILTLLVDLALLRSVPSPRPSSTLRTSRRLIVLRVALILAVLIGLEEFSQQYFPHRSFDLVDLAFSYLGVIFFSFVALRIKE